jgi:DNA modification methylase
MQSGSKSALLQVAPISPHCQKDMQDTSKVLKRLSKEYRASGAPIAVSFRDLVSWIPYNSTRYSHSLHSYPAKVIPQIPHFFLNCKSLVKQDAKVLDPFGGSGTVALEACLAGVDAIVSDSNPLARLITKVKTKPISPEHLQKSIQRLRKLVLQSRTSTPPDVVNIEYWYHSETIKQLSRIVGAIEKLESSPFQRLSLVALSMTARKVSLADPRIAVPVRLKPDRYPTNHPLRTKSKELLRCIEEGNAISVFFEALQACANQIETLWEIRGNLGKLEHIYENSLGSDTRSLSRHPENSIDGIITSPPYLGAQKYIRSSSLSLGWLSMSSPNELRPLSDKSIGREHFPKHTYTEAIQSSLPAAKPQIERIYNINPLRAQIAVSYLEEMRQVITTCHKLLKHDGVFVLVSGCNILSGEKFDTTAYLKDICVDLGFNPMLEVTDVIKSRGLMTRRNKTASIIPLESVILFRK